MRERGSPILHFLDRYAGIPAVSLLGISRRKRPFPTRIGSIGLLKTGGIGDTVLVSAVLSDLRQAFPYASIVLFCSQSNFEIARMLDGIDRVVKVPVVKISQGWKAVRSASLDVLLDFGHWSRVEALLAQISRAKFTVGFRTQGQYRHYGYDLTVTHSAEVHELENYRRVVRALGVPTRNQPALRMANASSPTPEGCAVLHLWPGGIRSELKQWPRENWVRLVLDLFEWELEVVLTGGPSDRQRNEALIESLPDSLRPRVRNAAGTALEETCAILARARLVVSVNTGVMHIAAALGAPLVALHGPTSSRRWGPISDKAIVIESPLSSCGYLNLGWEYPRRPPKCMEAIAYETVRDACRAFLAIGSPSAAE